MYREEALATTQENAVSARMDVLAHARVTEIVSDGNGSTLESEIGDKARSGYLSQGYGEGIDNL